MAGRFAAKAEARQVLFFAKKNQKTFATFVWQPGPAIDRMPAATGKSFLVLFCKKEHLPCFVMACMCN
jgi:hypothetical protein